MWVSCWWQWVKGMWSHFKAGLLKRTRSKQLFVHFHFKVYEWKIDRMLQNKKSNPLNKFLSIFHFMFIITKTFGLWWCLQCDDSYKKNCLLGYWHANTRISIQRWWPIIFRSRGSSWNSQVNKKTNKFFCIKKSNIGRKQV